MLDLKYQTHYLFTLLSHTYIIISDFDGKFECKLLYIFCKYITQTVCLAFKTSKAICRFFYVNDNRVVPNSDFRTQKKLCLLEKSSHLLRMRYDACVKDSQSNLFHLLYIIYHFPAEEWISGRNASPILMSLKAGSRIRTYKVPSIYYVITFKGKGWFIKSQFLLTFSKYYVDRGQKMKKIAFFHYSFYDYIHLLTS